MKVKIFLIKNTLEKDIMDINCNKNVLDLRYHSSPVYSRGAVSDIPELTLNFSYLLSNFSYLLSKFNKLFIITLILYTKF